MARDISTYEDFKKRAPEIAKNILKENLLRLC